MNEELKIPEGLDPRAVNMARAIRKRESNGNYNAIGDNGTSRGAYQWQPDTWISHAKEAGLDPNDFSPKNQDMVAYKVIKNRIDKGYQVPELAAEWNSGNRNNWKDHKGVTVINGKEIAYDTPKYAQDVNNYYQELKQKTQPFVTDKNIQIETEKPSFSSNEKLRDEITRRRSEISDIKNYDQSIISKGLQQAGQVAGLTGSLVSRGISAITPNFIETPIARVGQKVAGHIAQAPIVQKGIEKYGQFAEKNPEAAKNIEAIGNIAAVVPQTKALSGVLSAEKSLAKGVIRLGKKGLAKTGIQEAKDEVLDIVTPKMSSKELQSAIKSGKGKTSGMIKNVSIEPSEKIKKAADTVRDIIDPNKTLVENVNTVKTALSNEAENLKNQIIQKDHPYVFKQLQSRLNKVQKPISVKANTIWNKQFDLVKKAAIDIAKKQGGKVSSLLEARKIFDDLVEKEIPNLYSATETPMKEAVKKIRREMNEFISDNLPEGTGFKESLARQSSMYDAIDGMASKAVEEVGTNIITRVAKRNPVKAGLVKRGIETAGAGGILKGLGILP